MATASPLHRPRRTCVGCRRTAEVGDLVRVGRLSDGTLRIGRTLPGRGAWLCRGSPNCLELAARQGGFARAFRTAVSPDRIDALRVELVAGDPPTGTHFVPGPAAARD